jgi:hypothetical protein
MASGIVYRFLHSRSVGWSLARAAAVTVPVLLTMLVTMAMFIGAWSDPPIETVTASVPDN